MAKCLRLLALLVLVHCVVFGAELTGIWIGEAPGKNGEKQDVAFQFKAVNGVLSGVMFGDEFDLPVQGLKTEGGRVSFSVTTTNYYSGSRLTLTYTGTISGKELQLTRERKDPPANERQTSKQILNLKRITP